MTRLALWSVLLVAFACNGEETDTDTDAVDTDVEPAVCDPVEVSCVDQMIQDLSLQDDEVTDGAVTSDQDGEDWVTTVDADGGGYSEYTHNPWVYVRFTDAGAVRVDIDDETALESQEWHIAARRFILRMNGGTSGPSCVGAFSFLEKSYDEVTEVPAGVVYAQDDFYTDSCEIVNDSSGLPGSPQVALAPWWSYDGCVVTTGHPFLIQLEDGRVVKLAVEAYYGSGQEQCNSTGSAGDDSGHYTWRWKFME